jgi:hypothetical protein
MGRSARDLYGTDTLQQHISRCSFLMDRIQACQAKVMDGKKEWARYDANVDATRYGVATTGKARRAGGRVTMDERELKARLKLMEEDYGFTERQFLALHYQRGDAAESFNPADLDDMPVIPLEPIQPDARPACGCKGERLQFMHRSCPDCGISVCLFWTGQDGRTLTCDQGHPLFPSLYVGGAA